MQITLHEEDIVAAIGSHLRNQGVKPAVNSIEFKKGRKGKAGLTASVTLGEEETVEVESICEDEQDTAVEEEKAPVKVANDSDVDEAVEDVTEDTDANDDKKSLFD